MILLCDEIMRELACHQHYGHCCLMNLTGYVGHRRQSDSHDMCLIVQPRFEIPEG